MSDDWMAAGTTERLGELEKKVRLSATLDLNVTPKSMLEVCDVMRQVMLHAAIAKVQERALRWQWAMVWCVIGFLIGTSITVTH